MKLLLATPGVASHWLSCLLAVALGACMQPFPLAAAEPRSGKPNVVFILIDDLGYADLGCYGATTIRTPHTDRLAREGVRLTQCYASPVCTPTRAALLTGRYPQRSGLEWALLRTDLNAGLKSSETTLARMLKDRGYATGCVGKWHLGFKPEFGPTAHGFQEFFGSLGGSVDMYSHQGVDGKPDLFENSKPVDRPGYLTDLFTDRAVAFIHQHKAEPFFLYLPYNAVHFPFQPPDQPRDIRTPKTWQSGTLADYVRMVERVDQGVGKILAELDRLQLADNTLVILSSDNGGDRLSDNAPLFHHKATLWEGGIRVPCLLRWPGVLPAKTVSEQPAITMDLTASILAAAKAPPPADRPLDGIDLLPILAGKAPVVERTFFWRIDRADRNQRAVRKGDWKYVRDGGETTVKKELLFDLAKDASERRDLSPRHPDVVAELRKLVEDWEETVGKSKTAKK